MTEESIAEEATGCSGAGGYRKWAAAQGYPYCEVWDWTSSAGDWTFFVSKTGDVWRPMFQTNRYPRQGFERTINETEVYFGSWKEVCEEISARYA